MISTSANLTERNLDEAMRDLAVVLMKDSETHAAYQAAMTRARELGFSND
jgi:hypothetical protein